MDTHARLPMLLTVNAGASSIRLDLFSLVNGEIERRARRKLDAGSDPAVARDFLEENDVLGVDAVIHRVVHGGPRLDAFSIVDRDVEHAIERAAPLAPMHNTVSLEWLRALRAALPEAKTFAAFDTGFYRHLPQVASLYAIPRDLSKKYDIRRYGFHGLAHDWMHRRFAALRPDRDRGGKLISLQLGAGCSITATERGEARDTSMGFTPLEGLVMATRAGDIDAGLVAFIEQAERLTPAATERLLNAASGLAGLSGTSGEMRELLASNLPAARLAIDVYCYRARKYIGAYLAVLRGADGIVFGGGTGENAESVRAQILTGLEWAGITIDPERNARANGRELRISGDGSVVEVYVVPVDEAAIMAGHAAEAMRR